MFLIFQHTNSQRVVYVVFAIVASLGTLLLLALRPLKPRPLDAEEQAEKAELDAAGTSVWHEFCLTVRLLGRPTILLLAPVFLLSGLELSFWAGGGRARLSLLYPTALTVVCMCPQSSPS